MFASSVTMLPRWMLGAVAASALAGTNGAEAADASARALAAGCRSCHQPGESAIPTLQGQSRNALVAKLRGFREGSKAGTVMPQLAKGYSDAELEAIARYFAEGEAPR